MSARALGVVALVLGPLAGLWTQLAGYMLVDGDRHFHSRAPSVAAVVVGALLAALGLLLSRRAYQRSVLPPDRFVGLLGVCLNGFFVFVVIFGFGVPHLFLGPTD